MKMIEVRVTRLPPVPNFRMVLQTGKGIVPKGVEAKDCPGNTENIRFTVAFLRSAIEISIMQAEVGTLLGFYGSRFVRIGSIFFVDNVKREDELL